MKIFVPMSDAALGADSNLYRELVPFDPAYLSEGAERSEGHKPANWITESNYQQARERLFATT